MLQSPIHSKNHELKTIIGQLSINLMGLTSIENDSLTESVDRKTTAPVGEVKREAKVECLTLCWAQLQSIYLRLIYRHVVLLPPLRAPPLSHYGSSIHLDLKQHCSPNPTPLFQGPLTPLPSSQPPPPPSPNQSQTPSSDPTSLSSLPTFCQQPYWRLSLAQQYRTSSPLRL